MKTKTRIYLQRSLGVSALLVTVLAVSTAQAPKGTVGEPVAHQNLQIFLLHANPALDKLHYATLSEALEKGFVVIKETGDVQQLTIENQSDEITVFLNAGDIVKGGRQDRTIRDDLVLQPKSGPVPLAAFCVEHGRWTGRGMENPAAFSANTKVLSSRDEKLAARYGMDQSRVWSSVADQQVKLNSNLSLLAQRPVEIRSTASASSLQLSLESKDLESVKKGYLDRLSALLKGQTDVVGFVFAINGEINSAEVYNNRNLFRALWPKLLDAAVTEAVTEYKPESRFTPVTVDQVNAFLQAAPSGTVKGREVWKTTQVNTYTTPNTVLFETLDLQAKGTWIHKSFIQKGKGSAEGR
jgi:hypothetical protein